MFDDSHFLDAKKIQEAIKAYGGMIRFVGGCVRDALIDDIVIDIDFATTLNPDHIELALAKAKIKSIPTGKKFGTITAILNGKHFEITTLRKDIKTDGRHAVVEYTDDWKEDAKRRDFTINAMSYDQDEQKLYDYFNGQDDLQKGLIRFVGVAQERVREDYLRILRFYRFYGKFGKILDQEAVDACRNNAENLAKLSSERKLAELTKIIHNKSWFKSLKQMNDDSILSHVISHIVTEYSIEALRQIHQENHSVKLELVLYILTGGNYQNTAKLLKLSNNQQAYFRNLHECLDYHKEIELSPRRFIYKFGEAVYFDALKIECAKKRDLKPYEKIKEKYMGCLIPTFPLRGSDIQEHFNIKEGKKIGNHLAKAETIWLDSEMTFSKAQLLHELAKL